MSFALDYFCASFRTILALYCLFAIFCTSCFLIYFYIFPFVLGKFLRLHATQGDLTYGTSRTGFIACFRACRFLRFYRFLRMARGNRIAAFGLAAAVCAGVYCFLTGGGAGRFFLRCGFLHVMVQGAVQFGAADGAGLGGGAGCFCASGMAQRGAFGRLAHRAGLRSSAVCCSPIMLACGFKRNSFLACNLSANGTAGYPIVAASFAASGLISIFFLRHTGAMFVSSGNSFGSTAYFLFAIRAVNYTFVATSLVASSRIPVFLYCCIFVLMRAPYAVHIIEGSGSAASGGCYISTITILQLGRSNAIDCNIRVGICALNLCKARLAIRLQFYSTAGFICITTDACTVSSGIDKASRKISHATAFYLDAGITISICNACCRSRIRKVHAFIIRAIFVTEFSPLLIIIQVELLTATQSKGCAIFNVYFYTGQQFHILVY